MSADDYVAALAVFGKAVHDIGDTEWDLPTPCTEWDVRAVVAHVVVGESQVAPMIEGAPGAVRTMPFDPSILGASPMSAWRGTALRAIEAVRTVEDPDARLVQHALGPLALSQVLGFRVTDNLVHAWDLATAVGRSLPLPDDLAETLLDFWLPLVPRLAETDFFGPMVEPPADPSPGERLLALLGRQVRR